MSNRICYVKSRKNPDMQFSRGHIAKKYGTRYDVAVNTKEYTYEIRNITSNRVVKRGKVNDGVKYPLHSIKIKIKKALKELKVEFGVEVRNVERRESKADI